MNRSVMIPAACCLLGFGALFAVFHIATGRETTAESWQPSDPSHRRLYGSVPDANRNNLASHEEMEKFLTGLSGEYLRPWKQWQNSPRHLYSRAAPRPIPSMSADIQFADAATGQDNGYLVATITISRGMDSQVMPCVVNRSTKEALIFADGQWLSQEEWLKTAPLP